MCAVPYKQGILQTGTPLEIMFRQRHWITLVIATLLTWMTLLISMKVINITYFPQKFPIHKASIVTEGTTYTLTTQYERRSRVTKGKSDIIDLNERPKGHKAQH